VGLFVGVVGLMGLCVGFVGYAGFVGQLQGFGCVRVRRTDMQCKVCNGSERLRSPSRREAQKGPREDCPAMCSMFII